MLRGAARGSAALLALAASLCAQPLSAAPNAPAAAQAGPEGRYQHAREALAAGDRQTFARLAASLEGHPLHADLRSAELRARIDSAEAGEVTAFLEAHRGTAPAERLRLHWLRRLADEERWAEYAAAYVDNGSETRECLYRRALHATGRGGEAFEGLDSLYLTGRSLPDACDPLFAAWSRSGRMRPELVWTRVERALARGNDGVAAFQGRYLPAEQQPWLAALIALHRQPEHLLEEPLGADTVADAARRRAILVHGIARLAASEPQAAAGVWEQIRGRETMTAEQAERAELALGEAFAGEGDARALHHLARIEARAGNGAAQRRRLNAALRLEAWPQLADWAAELPASADPRGKWRYWRGRALARDLADPTARTAAAHAFAAAAGERTLWGFLAAELIGRPPALEHVPVPAAEAAVEALLKSATVQRMRVLAASGRQAEVAREWREMTRRMTRDQRLAAAVAAARLGLTNESILTLANAAYWDDLRLRFPLAHRARVRAAADEHGLPLDWLYAVIRQESAFDADIASHAGAVGLMQLMPATAREVARRRGRPPPSTMDLIDPGLNIALGSAYLARMQRRFGGHPLLASAAYNAGPNAVERWLPQEPMAGDLWLTRIPYRETRDYVRRVLTYRVIYRYRLGLPPLRVGALLRPVGR